jgi:hypothetical protein
MHGCCFPSDGLPLLLLFSEIKTRNRTGRIFVFFKEKTRKMTYILKNQIGISFAVAYESYLLTL